MCFPLKTLGANFEGIALGHLSCNCLKNINKNKNTWKTN